MSETIKDIINRLKDDKGCTSFTRNLFKELGRSLVAQPSSDNVADAWSVAMVPVIDDDCGLKEDQSLHSISRAHLEFTLQVLKIVKEQITDGIRTRTPQQALLLFIQGDQEKLQAWIGEVADPEDTVFHPHLMANRVLVVSLVLALRFHVLLTLGLFPLLS